MLDIVGMSQYNDRPQTPGWQKALMGSRFPRDARRDYCVFTLVLQLFLAGFFALLVLPAFSTDINVASFLFLLLSLCFTFVFGKQAVKTFKALLESLKLSDIEALWKMEYESVGMKGEDLMYARAWVDTFPELAERIDPETGNVDLKRDPSDKFWWELTVEIRSMIYNCPVAQKAPKRKGTGRHSY